MCNTQVCCTRCRSKACQCRKHQQDHEHQGKSPGIEGEWHVELCPGIDQMEEANSGGKAQERAYSPCHTCQCQCFDPENLPQPPASGTQRTPDADLASPLHHRGNQRIG